MQCIEWSEPQFAQGDLAGTILSDHSHMPGHRFEYPFRAAAAIVQGIPYIFRSER